MDGKKILVVEDNQFNLELIVEILQVRNYEVFTAATGMEAIELTKKEMPDLILMDLQLPVMDGYEATRRIKGNPQFKDIPVIALTSCAMKEEKEKILEAGCDGYIAKPIDTRKIVDQISGFLKKGRR